MLKIKDILSGSIAESIGLLPDDIITSINGFNIKDEIDFKFHSVDDLLNIIVRRGKVNIPFKVRKEYGESLGADFYEMDMYECGANCIFCFVHQNPPGMRKTIYFKDGDYRMSFLYGNYVTLTNVGPNALKRIITQRLSPIYISVHSTIPEIRIRYMNLKKNDHILDKLKYLVDGGIRIHAQIVLSPGINDGDSLFKTITDLYSLSHGIESLAIVPVGLTKHRKGLANLKRVTKKYAKEIINKITPLQYSIRKSYKKTWIYLSDEFYLLAEEDIPESIYYDEYPQIENGVGMCRELLENFEREFRRLPKRISAKRKIIFATGQLAYPFLFGNIIPRLNTIKNLDVEILPVKNTLFGSSVTVSGLLSMKCLINGLKNRPKSDALILPSNIVNHDGLFLDDGTPALLEKKAGLPVYIFNHGWKELLKYVENL